MFCEYLDRDFENDMLLAGEEHKHTLNDTQCQSLDNLFMAHSTAFRNYSLSDYHPVFCEGNGGYGCQFSEITFKIIVMLSVLSNYSANAVSCPQIIRLLKND